jgi:hypothetical protein
MLRHLPEPHYARARLLEIVIRGNFGQHSGFQIGRNLLCEKGSRKQPCEKTEEHNQTNFMIVSVVVLETT